MGFYYFIYENISFLMHNLEEKIQGQLTPLLCLRPYPPFGSKGNTLIL